ncbi:MAG: imidazole glycerol phosphate synthase subunit HisH [Candidatus Omnitrophica bacterium]|nr:imidazole glycerol phosphate synthase subunit HisH [Candidatus Omnitrophota bacterium]MDD5512160.1 imidazole glycerol phosphate synthase subunit HisH [Candidatus Omnitrophota bacterium]
MIAIVDYGLGNLKSVYAAVKRLGFEAMVTRDHAALEQADKLILPGVGAFGDGMNNLAAFGLREVLSRMVIGEKKPILGICLGAQLFAGESFEFGRHKGLGWIPASVVRLPEQGLPVPHVGWNDLFQKKSSILFDGVEKEDLFYYVHSFYLRPDDSGIVFGESEYGVRFSAVIQQDNIYATQFHPEKSQLAGLKLLDNFLKKS